MRKWRVGESEESKGKTLLPQATGSCLCPVRDQEQIEFRELFPRITVQCAIMTGEKNMTPGWMAIWELHHTRVMN